MPVVPAALPAQRSRHFADRPRIPARSAAGGRFLAGLLDAAADARFRPAPGAEADRESGLAPAGLADRPRQYRRRPGARRRADFGRMDRAVRAIDPAPRDSQPAAGFGAFVDVRDGRLYRGAGRKPAAGDSGRDGPDSRRPDRSEPPVLAGRRRGARPITRVRSTGFCGSATTCFTPSS